MTELDRPKMTHNEIIDTLKGLVFGTFDRTTAREREALDEAITVLEQEQFINKPCVSNRVCEHDKQKILDKIRAEIEQAADKQIQIAMGVSDLNERYAHIRMENAYRHSLNVIDKYKESEDK